MKIIHVKCDILEIDCQVICHQVNCMGAMRSGVAKAIREKWPVVYETYLLGLKLKSETLGTISVADVDRNKHVVNMYSQYEYGYDGKRYTSYDAFCSCIEEIKAFAIYNDIKSIAFPYNIGCCRGGANWNVIYTMIESVFNDTDLDIYICQL